MSLKYHFDIFHFFSIIRLILIQRNSEDIAMKRMLTLIVTVLFFTPCFADAIDTANIHSAIQHAFSNNSMISQNALSLIYSGKDISRPQVAVSDERSAAIQPRIMG